MKLQMSNSPTTGSVRASFLTVTNTCGHNLRYKPAVSTVEAYISCIEGSYAVRQSRLVLIAHKSPAILRAPYSSFTADPSPGRAEDWMTASGNYKSRC
jgi:hypothetical protein